VAPIFEGTVCQSKVYSVMSILVGRDLVSSSIVME
jgi:hypothetical protein